MKDRRIAERFPLNIPVIFRWTVRNGVRRRANGFARDISRAGVFVLTKNSPPVGARIRLDLFLPPLGEHAAGMRVEGQGRVVRVEASPLVAGTSGFAAKHMKLLLWEFEAGV